MKAFLPKTLKALPANLRRGLRPGVGGPDDSPARRMRRNFLYHLHPLEVTERALRPLTTLGLGVITLTLFLVLLVTGVLLMVYYLPTVRDAYASMQDIQYAVTFGAFTRALHRWSAQAMVVVVLLHLVRVAATGGYRGRELNWMVGLGLGLLTLGLSFTGYLLPWDQRSFWAVSVASNMLDSLPLAGSAFKTLALGGGQVGQAALLRFYMLHVALMPAALVVLLALHLWRIRKDGGLAASASDRRKVAAWPHLVLREAILVILVLSILFLVASLVEAPLGAPVNPQIPSNPEKAPWYFLWVQEMVSQSATVGVVLFPGLLLSGLLLLPFLEREAEGTGAWFGPPSSRWAALVSLLVAAVAFAVFYLIYLGGQGESKTWAQELQNPAFFMTVLALVASVVAGLLAKSVRAALLAGLVVMLVAVVGCTVVGLCRGPDWVFYWPWKEWSFVA